MSIHNSVQQFYNRFNKLVKDENIDRETCTNIISITVDCPFQDNESDEYYDDEKYEDNAKFIAYMLQEVFESENFERFGPVETVNNLFITFSFKFKI